MDLIRCPQCGEQYSASYPRCPFCEEEDDSGSRRLKYRPRRHIVDKRKAQSARGGMIVVLVAVLALLSWYLFGDSIARPDKTDDEGNTPSTQDEQPSVPANNPSASDPFFEAEGNGDDDPLGSGEPSGAGGDVQNSEPQPPVNENVDVSGAKLNRDDFTLGYEGEKFTVKLSGTEATPTWSIDNPNVAAIAADGTVTAVANGDTTIHCKVGSRDLACTVRVRNTGKTAAAADAPMVAEPIVPTAPAAPGSNTQTPNTQAPSTQTPNTQTPSGTHVDAASLSVKTNYGTMLKEDPGTGYPDCTVRIGGDPITLSVVGTDVPVSSWTSDKTSVVEISSDGHLTPVSAGTAHVTAKVGDAEITCIIRVR